MTARLFLALALAAAPALASLPLERVKLPPGVEITTIFSAGLPVGLDSDSPQGARVSSTRRRHSRSFTHCQVSCPCAIFFRRTARPIS